MDQSKRIASPPTLNADTYWVHLLKDMVHSGEAAKIGPYAFAVYMVIKAHTNANGTAFPSVPTIAEKSGMSEPQVKRQLKILTETGFLTNLRPTNGTRNIYALREKIHIQGGGEGGCGILGLHTKQNGGHTHRIEEYPFDWQSRNNQHPHRKSANKP